MLYANLSVIFITRSLRPEPLELEHIGAMGTMYIGM